MKFPLCHCAIRAQILHPKSDKYTCKRYCVILTIFDTSRGAVALRFEKSVTFIALLRGIWRIPYALGNEYHRYDDSRVRAAQQAGLDAPTDSRPIVLCSNSLDARVLAARVGVRLGGTALFARQQAWPATGQVTLSWHSKFY